MSNIQGMELLPKDTVTDPFCVGVPVKHKQPVSALSRFHAKHFLLDFSVWQLCRYNQSLKLIH